MTSLTDLGEVVDVVIGVDTRVQTHSAAVVDAATGGVLGEITVDATAEGYAELVEFAGEHVTLRAWAIEGTGGHGASLSRHFLDLGEIVVDLDRPKRAARRNGAKSEPLDAIRAARWALARTRLGTPRSGGERQGLSVLLATSRSAVNAATEAQQQVFSLVIAAPEPIRARFRGQKLPGMLATAAALRVHFWPSFAAGAPTCSSSFLLGCGDGHHGAGVAVLGTSCPRADQGGSRASVRSWPRPCCAPGPGRIHSEAAFAMLAGVAPIPANSGQVTTR
jgi:transposase